MLHHTHVVPARTHRPKRIEKKFSSRVSLRQVVIPVIALVFTDIILANIGHAQTSSPRVEIVLPTATALTTEGPSVKTSGIVTATHTAELIRNGFPARLHYKMERWAAGTFVNDVKSTTEWEIIVEYDALSTKFRVVRATDQRAVSLGEFATLRDADAKIAEPYRVTIGLPKKGEKTYYTLKLDVEAMSLSDLDEVRRWLNGELRPAVRGERNPGTAVTSGVRTLFVRLLGGERVQYETNSDVVRP